MENTKVELIYTLSFEEVRDSLYATNRLQISKTKSMVQTVIATIATLLFAGKIIADPKNTFNYFVVVICLMIIPFVWIFPLMTVKNIVNTVRDGKELRLELFSDKIIVHLVSDMIEWEALAEESLCLTETDGLYIITLPRDRLLSIPKRVIKEENKDEVMACMEQFKKEI